MAMEILSKAYLRGQTKKWINERAPKYDELLNIILDGKDKMIGHAGKITKNEAKELLDLVIKIAKKYS